MQQSGELFGSDARPAAQALLHPTGNPVESYGPLSGAGPRVSSKVERKAMRNFIGRLTVRAKVDIAQWNAATFVIVDAHRQVVAIHERNCQTDIKKG